MATNKEILQYHKDRVKEDSQKMKYTRDLEIQIIIAEELIKANEYLNEISGWLERDSIKL